MIDDVRSCGPDDGPQISEARDVREDRFQTDVRKPLRQLTFDREQVVLGLIDQREPRGHALRELTSELGTHGAARAGDEHPLLRERLPIGRREHPALTAAQQGLLERRVAASAA